MAGPRRLQFGNDAPAAPTQTQTPTPTIDVTPAPAPQLPTVATKPNIPELQNIRPGQPPLTIEQVGEIGSKAQQEIASVTSRITGVAKTSDMDAMGKLLGDTILAAKGYDPKNLFKGGLFGFVKAKSAQISMKFDNVDKSVERLVGQVEQKVQHFRQRVQDLEAMRLANEKYREELTPQIEKAIQIADWMDQNPPAVDQNDPMSGQRLQDWLTVASFARKRADDLRRAQILADQQSAQINQMKLNSSALAQKFTDIKVTTIPAMKTTFTLYVANMEQKKGAEMADSIDHLTNTAIQANADLLGKNTVAIHTSLTRSNISMESLNKNFQSIVQSLDDVKRIHAEMKQRIASEAPQLEKLSQDLTLKLAER